MVQNFYYSITESVKADTLKEVREYIAHLIKEDSISLLNRGKNGGFIVYRNWINKKKMQSIELFQNGSKIVTEIDQQYI
jgi:hypothetical protein